MFTPRYCNLYICGEKIILIVNVAIFLWIVLHLSWNSGGRETWSLNFMSVSILSVNVYAILMFSLDFNCSLQFLFQSCE